MFTYIIAIAERCSGIVFAEEVMDREAGSL
jgi:hypothetical protein